MQENSFGSFTYQEIVGEPIATFDYVTPQQQTDFEQKVNNAIRKVLTAMHPLPEIALRKKVAKQIETDLVREWYSINRNL